MWQNWILYNYPGAEVVIYLAVFVIGVILAPWSLGFIYFLLGLLVFEFLAAMTSKLQSPWRLDIRIAIVGASFLGFVAGRAVLNDSKPLSCHLDNKPHHPGRDRMQHRLKIKREYIEMLKSVK